MAKPITFLVVVPLLHLFVALRLFPDRRFSEWQFSDQPFPDHTSYPNHSMDVNVALTGFNLQVKFAASLLALLAGG